MEKKRTHLTPNEVQEFIDLGVDFGETEMYWNISDCSECAGVLPIDIIIGEWGRLNPSQVDISLVEGKDDSADYCLPAPNLSEVLEVLDKVYRTKGSQWMWGLNPLHSKYVCSIGMITASNCIRGVGNTPLIAATIALRQLCSDHPETLTSATL